jgi:DNA polymerase/3'-5' exonuclease PolX
MLTYPEARRIADSLLEAISPHCVRAEVAGSIRRKKPVVKDLEIVAIAKCDERSLPGVLFEEPVNTDALFADWAETGALYTLPAGGPGRVQWIKPGTRNGTPLVPWKVEPFGSYWRGLLWLGEQPESAINFNIEEELLPPHVKLDLFLTTREKWGVIMFLRTGSKDFNTAVIEHINTNTLLRIREGRVMDRGATLDTPEEANAFDAFGLQWVEPEHRKDKSAVRRIRIEKPFAPSTTSD